MPKNHWQRLIYKVGIIWPSFWPAKGIELLQTLAKLPKYEFFLLTGRYNFTRTETYGWLEKNKLAGVFKKIYLNENNQQPHVFKKEVIQKIKLDYYVEDNLDIVRDLKSKGLQTKIYWIYNISDSFRPYPDRFPHLEKALEKIASNESTG